MMEPAVQDTDDQLLGEQMVEGFRQKLGKIMDHKTFDLVMGAIIFANVFVIAWETNANVVCEDLSEAERQLDDMCNSSKTIHVNVVFICIYLVEISSRLFVLGFVEFMKNGLNVIDMIVIAVGAFEIASDLLMVSTGDIPNIQILRIFRVLRLVRAVRVLQFFPELYAMVQGFASAMRAMFWGLVMILILLFIWSILAVEFVHPRNEKVEHNDPWCADAFSSVQLSMLLFWQTVVAGDAWGNCAVGILRAYPETSILFGGVLMCVQMGFTNLILSVVVDNAASAREANVEAKAAEFRKHKKDSYATIEVLIKSMDADGNGHITATELITAFHSNKELRTILECLDIDEDRLQDLFDLMDKDGCGEIQASLVVDAIRRATGQDSRMQMLGMQMSIAKIAREVHSLKKTVRGPGKDLGLARAISMSEYSACNDFSDSRSDVTGTNDGDSDPQAAKGSGKATQSPKELVKAVISAKLKRTEKVEKKKATDKPGDKFAL